MFFFLFIISVFSQDVKNCGPGMYFNVNSGEGGKCEAVNNCNKTFDDNFSGCEKCYDGFFNFRGQCHACNCGNEANGNKIECRDGIGCPKCAEKYVMVETVNPDKSVMYTCTYLPTEKPDLTMQGIVYTEYQMRGNDTHNFCAKWGERGCTHCAGNITNVTVTNGIAEKFNVVYYVNASMCYENTHCTQISSMKEVDIKSGEYKCTNCTQARNQNEKSYYLLNGVCVPCDGNCTKCDLNTGYCTECFPGYYPLDDKSKKCYPCDPNCDINSCSQKDVSDLVKRGSCTKCRSDASRNETYYLVANKYCIRMPSGCKKAETDQGCTECNDGYFLVPYHYNGYNNFHYKIAGKRIGMCVPHQKACPAVNRTATGCKGCNAGYVVDTMKWNHDGKDYSIGICSGASSVVILALIAFLVLLF